MAGDIVLVVPLGAQICECITDCTAFTQSVVWCYFHAYVSQGWKTILQTLHDWSWCYVSIPTAVKRVNSCRQLDMNAVISFKSNLFCVACKRQQMILYEYIICRTIIERPHKISISSFRNHCNINYLTVHLVRISPILLFCTIGCRLSTASIPGNRIQRESFQKSIKANGSPLNMRKSVPLVWQLIIML